jgi:hypothetical protein
LKSFTIQAVKGSIMPEVVKIYPSTDKVPENLLKIYIQFSLPMQEVGNALDFIRVTDESDGKTVDIFLRLESELWNKEHDLLTLWLDPGRIKTGLIPNMSQGLPLTAGHTYTVDILTDWKSANGQRLEEAYKKTFHVGQKDTIRPDPGNWDLQLPRADSREALELSFTENLDAILLRESLYFQDADGKDIAGFYQWDSLENSVKYVPFKNWHKGVYSLLVNSKLEDLAGNSLTRLFDEQLEEKAPVPGDTIATKRQFRIN